MLVNESQRSFRLYPSPLGSRSQRHMITGAPLDSIRRPIKVIV